MKGNMLKEESLPDEDLEDLEDSNNMKVIIYFTCHLRQFH